MFTPSDIGNLFNVASLRIAPGDEQSNILLETNALRFERIVSNNHTTPPDTWYCQEEAEWVLLTKGSAEIEYDTGEKLSLDAGDYIFIPSGIKHRVRSTSAYPDPAIWLAIFIKNPNTL